MGSTLPWLPTGCTEWEVSCLRTPETIHSIGLQDSLLLPSSTNSGTARMELEVGGCDAGALESPMQNRYEFPTFLYEDNFSPPQDVCDPLCLSPERKPRDVIPFRGEGHRWMCSECFFSFQTSEKLEAHARAEKHLTYKCDHCSKSFSRRDSYAKHATRHKSKFVCKICSLDRISTFTRLDQLRRHERHQHPGCGQQVPRRTSMPHHLFTLACG